MPKLGLLMMTPFVKQDRIVFFSTQIDMSRTLEGVFMNGGDIARHEKAARILLAQ